MDLAPSRFRAPSFGGSSPLPMRSPLPCTRPPSAWIGVLALPGVPTIPAGTLADGIDRRPAHRAIPASVIQGGRGDAAGDSPADAKHDVTRSASAAVTSASRGSRLQVMTWVFMTNWASAEAQLNLPRSCSFLAASGSLIARRCGGQASAACYASSALAIAELASVQRTSKRISI